MSEHLLIGFLLGVAAHVHYVKAVYRIKLEVNLHNAKRRAKRLELERSLRKQRTRLNNKVNN